MWQTFSLQVCCGFGLWGCGRGGQARPSASSCGLRRSPALVLPLATVSFSIPIFGVCCAGSGGSALRSIIHGCFTVLFHSRGSQQSAREQEGHIAYQQDRGEPSCLIRGVPNIKQKNDMPQMGDKARKAVNQ